MANVLVPAETLPVLGATELVATIPVPASPSGGHIGTPASRFPLSSSSATPSLLKLPANSPAVNTFGKTSLKPFLKPCFALKASNFSTICSL